MAWADHVALETVQLLEPAYRNPVFSGNFSEAVSATYLVVAVLGKFFLVKVFVGLQGHRVDFRLFPAEFSIFEIKDGGRVNIEPVVTHFEMQVCPEGTARIAAFADGIPGL